MPKIILRPNPHPASSRRACCVPASAPWRSDAAPVVLDLPCATRITREIATRFAAGQLPLHLVLLANS